MDDDLVERVRRDAGQRLDKSLSALFFEKWDAGTARPEDFHPHIRSVVRQAVEAATPKPELTFEPRDNAGAGWAIAIGIVILVGGLLSIADAPGWGVLGAGVGLVVLVNGSRSWTSPATYEQNVRSQREAAVTTWKAERTELWRVVCDKLFMQLHVVIGRREGVPERVLLDFARESIEHAALRKGQWRLSWWVAQPEYPPPPGRRLERLGHDAYEDYCAAWMRSAGWTEATVTQYSRDGGIDIVTKRHVVQCKHYAGSYVGPREVREIFGVAAHEQKRAVVITSGRFTKDATDFAARAGVALVHLDELNGEARALNAAAVELLAGPVAAD